MKHHLVTTVVALAAALTGNCLALTPVLENFTGSELDTTRWYQTAYGSGLLTQADGHLNYVVSSKPTPGDYAVVELMASQPGFNESWDLTFSISNTSNAQPFPACGISLFNVDDRTDYLSLDFFGKHGGIHGGVVVNGNHPKKSEFSVNPGVAQGSIRIHFNSVTKLMTFSTSASQKAPYHWKARGTFSPAGKGGLIKANWKMAMDTGKFGIQLLAYSNSLVIRPGKVTFDKVNLTASP